ncbi:MAG TPA: DUF4428 domain-containing protein [Clostridiaceae bacterium]|nr:DUF4428 domain-containing protein [Clostridiaceae bacterium]
MALKDLFKSKNCDVCGEKIKLLGNRKLEDGNICSKCAKKLSPFFSERRKSTLLEIKEQLQYRAENEQDLNNFTPTRIFGNNTKIMIDEKSRKFIVTSRKNWQEYNPDLISLDQITYCNLKVDEDKREIYREDKEGKRVSYEPRRYEYKYAFWIEIGIQSPWFDEIRFELSTIRPENRFDRSFKEYEREGEEIREYMNARGQLDNQSNVNVQQASSSPISESLVMPIQSAPGVVVGTPAGTQSGSIPEDTPASAQTSRPKFCPNCGTDLSVVPETSRFCPGCGSALV